MKTIAVISDIHGNSLALQAVFDDLKQQGGAEQILNLGDLAVFGPDPAGVLDLIIEYPDMVHVLGNTDRYLVEKQYPGEPGGTDWQSQVLASFPWTADQIGKSGIEFLRTMPARQYLQPTPLHQILGVHGSPRGDEENMLPTTPDELLREMLAHTPPHNLLLCAHTHLPFDRILDGRRIINVGSVGLPFDGTPQASYAIIQFESDGGYQVNLRRVAYDIDAVVEQLNEVDHPTAEVSAYNLRAARPLGSTLVYTKRMREGTGKMKPLNSEINPATA